MQVIVTRPQREAQDWVQALRQAGHQALALPLISIAPAPDAAALQQAWRRLGGYLGLMFVSANAVDGFFAARPADAPWPAQAWATGPGTVNALLRAGVPASQITAPPADAAQFDSEALWQQVASRIHPGVRVLIVRGADAAEGSSQGTGRDWFARQVGDAGGTVDFVASYQRQRPLLDTTQRQLAQAAAGDGSVWLFSSSEAVLNLQASLPQQDWGAARAVATHARIAQAARAAGFAVVRESRPALADVRASIESMQ
ncbi:MAG: uroporphyrinogen-III synthase [Burkholderiales bacterium]|nr:uroporphyrinogen-III synthase [Burkholderiales bacterium]